MSAIFNIFAVPFGIVMRWIYQFVGNYGLSVILFSILAKLIMLPLTVKQKRGMIKTQMLQPKLQELQRKYGKDQQRLQQEMQDLYAREGTSPTAGCGTTLLTFPVMIGLYYVIQQPLSYFMRITYEQIEQIAALLNYQMSGGYTAQVGLAAEIFRNFDKVSHISENLMRVDYNFLGVNLAAVPQWNSLNVLWLVPIISGLTAMGYSWLNQWMTKKMTPDAQQNDQMAKTNKMMLFMTPAMSLFIGFTVPAGLSLYWITNNLVMAVQDFILNRYFLKKKEKTGSIE